MEEKNTYHYDTNISLRAKGILALALELQANGIKATASELERHSKEGSYVLRSALTELTNEGYLIIKIDKDTSLAVSHSYTYYTTPHAKSKDRVDKKFKQRIYY